MSSPASARSVFVHENDFAPPPCITVHTRLCAGVSTAYNSNFHTPRFLNARAEVQPAASRHILNQVSNALVAPFVCHTTLQLGAADDQYRALKVDECASPIRSKNQRFSEYARIPFILPSAFS